MHLPRSALTTLSHRCAALGPAGREALREAGYRAGTEVLGALGETPAALPPPEFWSRLDGSLRRAGLGSVEFEPVSSALGAIAWRGSAEAAGAHAEGAGPQCHFAVGLLGGVLSRAAGRTVDVAEVRCGGGGPHPCWFLFGSVEMLQAVRTKAREARASVGD